VGISLVIAEWVNLLPKTAYLFGGLLAAFGSIVLLLLHAILQPKHRQDVMPLVILLGISITPVILLGLATLFNPLSTVNILGLITLIALPVSYLLAVYRHQLGQMELRHNRIVSILVFLGLLSIIFILGGIIIESYYRHINSTYVVALTLFSAVTASLITIIFYPPVRRFVERHIIGIPHDTTYLTETYSARITTSLDKASLARILTDEILPSLMIRKSALYRLKGTTETQKMFSMGLSDHELPDSDVVKHFLQESQEVNRRNYHDSIIHHDSWICLVIPLKLENREIGVWLFGRRDPDDDYSKSEIKSLQSIADQTAIALINIEQAEYLHKLYQTNIDRQEIERQKLALELHDQILSQLAIMIMNPRSEPNAEISDICADIAASIRKMVDGLRPAMLNYGLCHAIEELCDNVNELSDNGLTIDIDLPFTDIRYRPHAELHLFRIIQQACNNILQHAHAHRIKISGSMEPKKVDIYIQDDGVGFRMAKTLDLPELLYKRNYGIVGMYERASLIGAILDISSSPGKGTTVHISWKTETYLYQDGEADKFVSENAI
jgi:signal transduction histidine kinase